MGFGFVSLGVTMDQIFVSPPTSYYIVTLIFINQRYENLFTNQNLLRFFYKIVLYKELSVNIVEIIVLFFVWYGNVIFIYK